MFLNKLTTENIIDFVSALEPFKNQQNVQISYFEMVTDEVQTAELHCTVTDEFGNNFSFILGDHSAIISEKDEDITVLWQAYLYSIFEEEYEQHITDIKKQSIIGELQQRYETLSRINWYEMNTGISLLTKILPMSLEEQRKEFFKVKIAAHKNFGTAIKEDEENMSL